MRKPMLRWLQLQVSFCTVSRGKFWELAIELWQSPEASKSTFRRITVNALKTVEFDASYWETPPFLAPLPQDLLRVRGSQWRTGVRSANTRPGLRRRRRWRTTMSDSTSSLKTWAGMLGWFRRLILSIGACLRTQWHI